MTKKGVFLGFLGVILWVLPSFAVNHYVDTVACTGNYSIANRTCTGSDGNSFTLMSDCLIAAVAGDSCLVRAGNYVTGMSFLNTSNGTAVAPKVLKPRTGETVIIGARMVFSGVSFVQVGEVGNGFRFQNFSDNNGAMTITATTDHGISCTVATPIGGTTPLTNKGSCGLVIEGNTFSNIHSSCTGNHCAAIYISANDSGGRRMAGLTVRKNVITQSQLGITSLVCDYCRFEDNVVSHARDDGDFFTKYGIKLASNSVFSYVGNNTIFDFSFMNAQFQGGLGIWFDVGVSDTIVEKNLIYDMQGAGLVEEGSSTRNIWRYNVVQEAKIGWRSSNFSKTSVSNFQVVNNSIYGSVETDICLVNIANVAASGQLVQNNILHGAIPFGVNSDREDNVTYGGNLVGTSTGNIVSRGASGGLVTNWDCVGRFEPGARTFTQFESDVSTGDVGTQAVQTFCCTGSEPPNLNLKTGSTGLAGCTGGSDCGAYQQPRVSSCSVEQADADRIVVNFVNSSSSLTVDDSTKFNTVLVNGSARTVNSATSLSSTQVAVEISGADVQVGETISLVIDEAAVKNSWCIGSSLNGGIQQSCGQNPATTTVSCSNNVSAPTGVVRTPYRAQVYLADETTLLTLLASGNDTARVSPGKFFGLALGFTITNDDSPDESYKIVCKENGGADFEPQDSFGVNKLRYSGIRPVSGPGTIPTRPWNQNPGTTFVPGTILASSASSPTAVIPQDSDSILMGVFQILSSTPYHTFFSCRLVVNDGTEFSAGLPTSGFANVETARPSCNCGK